MEILISKPSSALHRRGLYICAEMAIIVQNAISVQSPANSSWGQARDRMPVRLYNLMLRGANPMSRFHIRFFIEDVGIEWGSHNWPDIEVSRAGQ